MRQGRHGVEPGLHGPGRHSIPGGLTAARACAEGRHATIADAFFRQPGPPTVPGDQARKNQMKRARIATGVLTATLLATAMPAAAFAMPGDIEEAVTQQGYNAYEYQSSEAADINANVIGTLTKGDKVKVSADENDWLRFEMEDGRIGYVWDEYMEAVGQ